MDAFRFYSVYLEPIRDKRLDVGLLVTAFVLFIVAKLPNLLVKLWENYRQRRILSKHPILNPVWDAAAKEKYSQSFTSLIAEGVEKFCDRPYRMNGFTGEVLILPPRYIDEYKRKWELDLSATTLVDFFPTYPGFEIFRQAIAPHDKVLINAVKSHMNPMLGPAIQMLAENVSYTVDKVIGAPDAWTEAVFSPLVLRCVSRMSAYVFLGRVFMDHPIWNKVTSGYVVNASRAVVALREKSPLVRPFVHWFIPECRVIRGQSRQVRSLMEPYVKSRLQEWRQNGSKPKSTVMDSIHWFAASADTLKIRNYDYISAEFTLAIASIRTVSSHIFATLLRLAMHPEYVEPLRNEIIAALGKTDKIDKNCLSKMRLLDSFTKETVRLNSFPTTLRRVALDDVTFRDGLVIPKGTYCMIAPPPGKDATIYGPDAMHFDGFRFIKLREAAIASNSTGEQWQYGSSGNVDTIFGAGVHVCPARFFATFQVKILVSYVLLNYDIKLPPEDQNREIMKMTGYERMIDHDRKLWFVQREPELDWNSLVAKTGV